MSDKTTAALAAEQADVEATTTQEPELLPAATLDELEQVDLGTVAEGERAPFRITDDRCADWAIRKIADERSEYDRLKALADEQIAAINEKVAAARKRMENGTSYLTSCLADFFATVPHKETKTTEKYRLLSGTLTFKKGTTKTKLDETKLVPWLKANGYTYGADVDPRAIFDVSMRMLMHITNDFQREWSPEIDEPMTRALKDRIINREQEKLDGYVSMGALLGSPVILFLESENSTTDVMNGDFRWDIAVTPTPPLKSASVYVAYTDAGFSVYYEGGDE